MTPSAPKRTLNHRQEDHTALVAIYGLVADPATIEQQLSGLGGVVPQEAVTLLIAQAHAVAATGPTKLGWGAALALALALYSATSGVKTLFENGWSSCPLPVPRISLTCHA